MGQSNRACASKAWIYAASLAGVCAASLAVSAPAQASCRDDKTTGTILGGVGGAVIGNSVSRGGGGAILGGLGGALIGRSIAGSNCRHERYAYYGRRYYGPPAPVGPSPGPATLYYDPYGNPVTPGAPTPTGATQTAYATDPYCRTETRSYYDDRVSVRQ